MKVVGAAILALCVSNASAFTAPLPSKAFSKTSLAASDYRYTRDAYETGVTERDQDNLENFERKLQSRLDTLPKTQPRIRRGIQPNAPMGGSQPNTYRGAINHESSFIRDDRTSPVQGGSLRTWSFSNPAIERVQIVLGTDFRPYEAEIELWHGPDNAPAKMRCYSDDGSARPLKVVLETPRGPNTVAIRNTGPLEFPMHARVSDEPVEDDPSDPLTAAFSSGMPEPIVVQGGAIRTYPFDPEVQNVRLMITTDGRPLNARVELLQGPSNNRQVIELYSEDGIERPFFLLLETPGSGNVIRILNSATIEFPMTVFVEAYMVGPYDNGKEAVMNGGLGRGFMSKRNKREKAAPYRR